MIEKTVISVVLVMVILMMLYLCAILILQHFFKKTQSEAIQLVNTRIESFIRTLSTKTPQTPLYYPVLIGSNGMFIRDEIVNNYFQKISDLYSIWYYENCYYFSNNVVVYDFRVYDYKGDNFEKKRIIYRVRQISERALQMHFHEIGVYGTPVDRFVAVELSVDILHVYIACNDAGFEEIAYLRKRQL